MKELDEFPRDGENLDYMKRLTPKGRSTILTAVNSEFLSSKERNILVKELAIRFSATCADPEDSISERKAKSELRAKISPPIFRGIEIMSVEEIKSVLSREYPGLKDREDIAKLLRVVEFHINISKQYTTGDPLPRGLCSKLEREYNIPHKEVKRILCEGETPYLFSHLDKAFSVKQANELLSRIEASLNGVINLQALDSRLDSYYLEHSLLKHKQYTKHRESAVKFFRFLDYLPQGGFCTDTAKLADIGTWDVQRWALEEKKPRHIEIARQIPSKPPRTGHKWLPLKIQNDHVLERFIEVPTEIFSPSTILELLDNLPVLRTRLMERYEREFGELPKPLALMYSLGVIVSDGTFGPSAGGNSSWVSLTASKKYSWHNVLGAGFCYCLGKLGVSATRKSDMIIEKDGKTFVNSYWRASSTPFLLWMKQELLGLKNMTPKSNSSIQADWILKMPPEWKTLFIQGLADGDGWASTRGFNTGISTARNQEFVERIFHSLGITASKTPSAVLIANKEDIRQAKQLPLFRHATERQERLETLVTMFDSMTGKWISGKEKEIVVDLYEKGLSDGEISEVLWRNYGVSRNPRTLHGFARRNGCKKDESDDWRP